MTEQIQQPKNKISLVNGIILFAALIIICAFLVNVVSFISKVAAPAPTPTPDIRIDAWKACVKFIDTEWHHPSADAEPYNAQNFVVGAGRPGYQYQMIIKYANQEYPLLCKVHLMENGKWWLDSLQWY